MARKVGGSRPGRAKRLRIDTESDLSHRPKPTADEPNAAATNYVSKRRRWRQRRGFISRATCVALVMVFLCVVFSVEEYAHAYYAAYFVSFGSFALMLPSALPTDNTRVRFVLYSTAWCGLCVLVFSVVFANRRWTSFRDGSCEARLKVPRWYCAWNVFFWLAVCPPSVALCWTMVKAARAPPIGALNCFWRAAGVYLITLGTHNALDQAVAFKAGLFETTGATKNLWRSCITLEIVTLGFLCCSNQFKLRTWKFVASLASVKTVATVRDDYGAGVAAKDPACLCHDDAQPLRARRYSPARLSPTRTSTQRYRSASPP
mmetsp:Transcript_1146/g.3421  ORF Transcript_1146/g.3421 Transcript_1146/m.3421 type:complete len:318 (-) Transcript_1146:113-1066(-)